MSNGLYEMNLLSKDSYTITNKFQFVETVEENLGFFDTTTTRKIQKGKIIVPRTWHTIIR